MITHRTLPFNLSPQKVEESKDSLPPSKTLFVVNFDTMHTRCDTLALAPDMHASCPDCACKGCRVGGTRLASYATAGHTRRTAMHSARSF